MARKTKQILYDESLEQPPKADRLSAMIRALVGGAEIDAGMRSEIIDALKRHEVRRENDRLRAQDHRQVAIHTFQAAAYAKKLVDDYGVKPTYAAKVATKEYRSRMGITEKDPTEGAVQREYRDIRDSRDYSEALESGDKMQMAYFDDALIAAALARVPKSAISGNK